MDHIYDYEEQPESIEESDTETNTQGANADFVALIRRDTFGEIWIEKQMGKDDDEFLDCSWLLPLRASTAPAWPLTELEEFKRSANFLLLESTMVISDKLIKTSEDHIDLDSEEGQSVCKKFLNQIERLCEVRNH